MEIDHRTKAPVVPSAPIEPPSAAIRKPGFARATTKPSHHVIALRSCLSSTSACAIRTPSLSVVARLVPIGTRSRRFSTTPLGRVSMGCVLSCREMSVLRDRSLGAAPAAPDRTRARPVLLATMAIRVHPGAERVAIDSAIEAGVPLVVVNLIPLPLYVRTMTLVGPEGTTLPHEEDLDAVRATAARAAALGVETELLRVRTRHALRALLEVARERHAGLLVFGPAEPRTLRFRLTARRLRRAADCLVWIAPDG